MPDMTLATLFPGFPLTLAGERITLRPIVVAELPIVERIWEGWQILIASGGKVLNPDAWEDLVALLGSASGRGVEWVKALDESAFETLLCHAFALNGEVLNPPQVEDGETLTWAQIAQRLIQGGHPFEAVKGYTLAQVRTFVEVVLEQEREAFASAITASSFAMVAPKDAQGVAEKIRRG